MIPTEILGLTTLPPNNLPEICLSPQPTLGRNTGVCPSQAVAWLAGEEHTTSPKTLCPVIGHIVDGIANSLGEEDPDRLLKPYLTSFLNTRSTPHFETLRARTAILWAIKINTTEWLKLAGFQDEFDCLADCPEPSLQPTPGSIDNLVANRQYDLKAVPDLKTGTPDLEVDQALGESAFHAIATMPKTDQMTRYFRGLPAVTYSAALTAKNNGRDLQPSVQNLQQAWFLLLDFMVRIADFMPSQADK